MNRLGEPVHHLGDVVKCVGELLRVGPVAVSEAGKVRGDQMVPVAESRQQRLKHPRRRWQSVKQKNDGSVCRPNFSIKNSESIDLHGAIGDLRFHGFILFLGAKT